MVPRKESQYGAVGAWLTGGRFGDGAVGVMCSGGGGASLDSSNTSAAGSSWDQGAFLAKKISIFRKFRHSLIVNKFVIWKSVPQDQTPAFENIRA